jgi:formylglycine-generating enzyme required for sulfatase activity
MVRRFGAAVLAVAGLAWLLWPSIDRLAAQGNSAAGRKMAFLVGVKNYDHADLKDLDFPEHDVEELASVLKSDGFQVVLLTTQAGRKDAQNKPTAGNIRGRLKGLLQGATKQDLMIVGLAGHGLQPTGSDDSYFCPSDALPLVKDGRPVDATRLISLGEILAQMSDAGIGHKLLLVDACRNDPSARSAKHRGMDHVNVAALPSQTGVLLSCSPGEYSFEDKSLGGGHGIFFYHVIEGLRGKAKDANDEVTWDELSIYVRPRVQATVKRLFGKDGGEQSPNAIGNMGGAPAMLARITADISTPLSAKRPDLLVAPFDQMEANKFRRAWAQYQQIEEELKNSLGMQLTLIPAGRFAMGSTEAPAQLMKAFPGANKDMFAGEQPVHRVTISRPFYLAKCEVTVEQFRKFVEATDYKTSAEIFKGVGVIDAKGKSAFEVRAGFNWRQWGVDQKDDWPVINVSWNDANAFCEWLSKKDGKKYRLPTEAEWEYACRAGTATRFYNGDEPDDLTKIANIADKTAKEKFPGWQTATTSDGAIFTGPVAQLGPNNFGLFDMLGSVREWCSDSYSGSYYSKSPEIDPAGPSTGSDHVLRGGGWNNAPVSCRSAARDKLTSAGCSCAGGFRVVAEPSPHNTPETLVAPFGESEARSARKGWARYHDVPEQGKNTIGMQLVLIPPGRFSMGSTPEEIAQGTHVATVDNKFGAEEHPQHRVRITKPFYLANCEVTKGNFRKFVEETGYKTEAEKDRKGGSGYSGDNHNAFVQKPSFTWRDYGVEQNDEFPVVNVSWTDAQAFCEWLSKKEGKSYRLPSEAEWEYACRAGTTSAYYNGDNPEELTQIENIADKTARDKLNQSWLAGGPTLESSDGFAFASPVRHFKANNFGLYDMLGNVREWCGDWFDAAYYGSAAGADPLGPETGANRVLRGGSWLTASENCRSASRALSAPTRRFANFGFRLAMAPQTKAATSAKPPAPLVASFGLEQAKSTRAAWAHFQQIEEEPKNTLGIQFNLIPPGEFSMGSTPQETKRARPFDPTIKHDYTVNEFGVDEEPHHRVRITRPFYLGTCEVTKGEFGKFVEETGYKTDAETDGKGGYGFSGKKDKPLEEKTSFSWRDWGVDQGNDSPVVNVSWNDVTAFCKWLSKKDGKTYRLPTEAEWEYACRAGSTTLYANGDDPEKLTQIGNVADKAAKEQIPSLAVVASSDGYGFTCAVGKFPANNFGVHDMVGNVWEWCQDWYAGDYYAQASKTDPPGPPTGLYKVFRGGGWNGNAWRCRSAARDAAVPSNRFWSRGFRLVLVPQTPSGPATAGNEPASLSAPFDEPAASTARKAWAKYQQIEADPKNSMGMQFILIPPGDFMMGSTPEQVLQVKRSDRTLGRDLVLEEQPQHQVELSRPFYIGAHEVTKGQFQKFVDETGYKTDAEKDGKGGSGYVGTGNASVKTQPSFNWRDPGFKQGDDHPVVNVSWNDAAEFCVWLSRIEGKKYRLPTEAEWEYACRAGTTSQFYNGDASERITQIANVFDLAGREKFPRSGGAIGSSDGWAFTSPVGQFPPNSFGLYDMSGNAIEWCQDWYSDDYYAKSAVLDPYGPPVGALRVARGGSWGSQTKLCRSAARMRWYPSTKLCSVGFRVVCESLGR